MVNFAAGGLKDSRIVVASVPALSERSRLVCALGTGPAAWSCFPFGVEIYLFSFLLARRLLDFEALIFYNCIGWADVVGKSRNESYFGVCTNDS